jgi:hypothetical protein
VSDIFCVSEFLSQAEANYIRNILEDGVRLRQLRIRATGKISVSGLGNLYKKYFKRWGRAETNRSNKNKG